MRRVQRQRVAVTVVTAAQVGEIPAVMDEAMPAVTGDKALPRLPSDPRTVRVRTLGFLGALFLKALNSTLRWQKIGLSQSGNHWAYGESVIVAIWHCDQLLAPYCYFGFRAPVGSAAKRPRALYALSSQHSDGRIIAEILSYFSIDNVAGSSTNGGVRALVQLKKSISKLKSHVSITPDGPKGPAREVKAGIISLSSQTSTPILPLGIAYSSYWKIKSWDRMLIPKPFSKACMIAGPPVHVAKDLTKSDLKFECERLSNILNQLKDQAETSLNTGETRLVSKSLAN